MLSCWLVIGFWLSPAGLNNNTGRMFFLGICLYKHLPNTTTIKSNKILLEYFLIFQIKVYLCIPKIRDCSLNFNSFTRLWRSPSKQNMNLICQYNNWPVRLGVRTPDFHSGNRGSIPLRATKSMQMTSKPCNQTFAGFFIAY